MWEKQERERAHGKKEHWRIRGRKERLTHANKEKEKREVHIN
jgi:hypothetical protein